MRKFAYALMLAVCNAQNYFQVVRDGEAILSSTYSPMYAANNAVDNDHNSYSRTEKKDSSELLPRWRYQFPS
jgi:hypothetical protein